jgi:hypothetical protein
MSRADLKRLARCCAALLIAASCAAVRADNPPRESNRELHVVGVHVGVTKTDGAIHGPRAVVTVNRPKKLVTLVVTAYNPITWEIKIAPGSSIEKVILGGYHRQAASGLPESVEVVNAAREGGTGQLTYCRDVDSANFRAVAHQLTKLTDLEIASFFGTYQFAPEFPIEVNASQDDPRLLRSYPQPLPASQVPQLEFSTLRLAQDPMRPFDVQAEWGQFTLHGPQLTTLKPVPAGVKRLIYDPEGKRHYGLTQVDIVEVDLLQLTAKKLDAGPNAPQRGRLQDLTWDARRKRLLVAGEHLHAFEPATGNWSVLMERPDVAAIAWHEKLDRLFAIALRYAEDGSVPCLCEYNAHGAMLKQTELTGPLVPGSFGRTGGLDGGPMQLLGVGEHLVLLLGAHNGRGENMLPRVAYCYVIEPATAKARLTSKQAEP